MPSKEHLRSQSQELQYIEAMRSVVDRTHITGTAAHLFEALFPPTKRIERFREEHITQSTEAKFTPQEKIIANELRAAFGFAKSGDGGRGEHDMPEYRMFFTEDESSFIHHLNELPVVKRMKNITMTNPLLDEIYNPNGPKKTNRADHSKIVAAAVFRDIIRMAIKTPELFIERVDKDVGYFEKMGISNAREVLFSNSSEFTQRIMKTVVQKGDVDESVVAALPIVIEYAKYLMLFTYLHDSKTPANSDSFMKASARYPGQSSIHYSEDTQLGKDIGNMTDSLQGNQEAIYPLFTKFQFDRNFFITMTRSYSEENDPTLGSALVKGKRKKGFVNKGGPPALETNNGNGDQSVFDRDQAMGIQYNFLRLAESILPGGVAHLYKNNTHVQQIGSFYERLQLLTYAIATGINKQQLQDQLIAGGIPPQELHNICVSPEEFEYGPNFLLMKTPFDDEILPVALEARPLKRLLETFAFLTFFDYQGDAQAPVERLFQDIICSLHDFQQLHQAQSKDSMYADGQMTDIARVFVESNDLEAAALLAKSIPLLNALFPLLIKKSRRLTERQLNEYLQANDKTLLISRDTSGVRVSRKAGSLMIDTLNGKSVPSSYLPIVTTHLRENSREENPFSFPNLLAQAEDIWKQHPIFYVITLDPDDVDILQNALQNTPDPYSRIVVERTLRYWMLDMNLHQYSPEGLQTPQIQIWKNPLKQEFDLPKDGTEEIQRIISENNTLIEQAQKAESSRL